jgi:hypothetical protein
MTIWVLFVIWTTDGYEGGDFYYEFKDKIQCQTTFSNMKKNFSKKLSGYCQEIRK